MAYCHIAHDCTLEKIENEEYWGVLRELKKDRSYVRVPEREITPTRPGIWMAWRLLSEFAGKAWGMQFLKLFPQTLRVTAMPSYARTRGSYFTFRYSDIRGFLQFSQNASILLYFQFSRECSREQCDSRPWRGSWNRLNDSKRGCTF